MLTLEQTSRTARTIREGLSRIVPPPGFPNPSSPVHAIEGLLNIERRIGEGRTAPVRVALFGPTGAGKSKIFNSLLGEMVSPASYRRPFTRRPVYYLHRSRKEIARSLRGDVRLHDRPGWEDRILIDSPDFDSVEAENRALAAQVYLEADAFIFVADVHKYADASTWSYLGRLRSEGKACGFVLNKLGGEEGGGVPCAPGSPLEDFRARLERLFRPGRLPGPIIAIPDRPAPDDDLIPDGVPGLAELREAIEDLASPARGGGATLLAESLRIDLRRFLSEWDRFAVPLREYREGIHRLVKEIDGAFAREAEELRRDLQAEIDPALKGEVYREVLRRIERIDVLRYPRRLLALPAIGIKTLLGRLWTRVHPAGPAVEARAAGDVMNLAILEGRLGSLADAARRAARAEAACPGLLGDDEYRALRPDHETATARYRQALSEFRTWAEERARTTASALTTENKAKFILSQIIYNTVVIGVQVKTAGTLTLTEMFTDGILSPLVAKVVGIAVSSERVHEFEAEARREFSGRLVEVLREVRDRFTAHLFSSVRGLEGIDRVEGDVEALRGAADELIRRFLEGED